MYYAKYVWTIYLDLHCLLFSQIPHKLHQTARFSTKMATGVPWREASSIIITAKASLQEIVGRNLTNVLSNVSQKGTNSQSKFDYRLLMLKRSGLSSFMANAFVFPGGMVELSDYSSKWWTVFNNVGVSNEELRRFCNSIAGPRPPIFESSLTLSKADKSIDDCFLPAITMRITAIRETFEETGILLLTSSKNDKDVPVYTTEDLNLKLWRERVHKNPESFLELCLEAKLCPNIWCLKEWWNWLTPNVGHRRYDTMFYVCCLPKIPEACVDQTEVTTLKWSTPEMILAENANGSVFLPPPQVYELARLLNFHHIEELSEFAKEREKKGVRRWMPVIASSADGAVSVLPGDDLYPGTPDIKGLFENPEYPYTIEELRNKSHDLNRLEINGVICTVCSNIIPICGHAQPFKYPSNQPVVQSFL